MTIPDKIDRSVRRHLINLGPDGFLQLIKHVGENCADILRKEPHAAPILRMLQRRYLSQRATPFHDAVMTVDLRTAYQADGSVKYQPQWVEAAFAAFADKKSNLQMQIGVNFPLDKCPILQTPQALALLVDGFCACKPVMDVAYPA